MLTTRLKKDAGSFKVGEQEAFYSKTLAICDAKYWGRALDIKLTDKKDTFTNINPSFQIVNYLVGANVDWGILTNGKLWRLYSQKVSSRSSTFYEVDLEDLIASGDAERFLYFFLFFRKEAFLKDAQSKTFLEHVHESSTNYAAELSDSLKDKVFDRIFRQLARGFLHYRKKELAIQTETDESLKDIYNGTLTLLYRLLFILYAEDRDLLPVTEPAYRHYSLARLKQRVAELRDKKSILTDLSTDLWSDLDTLFRIVDIGDPKLNVPTYNGGLFSQKNPKNDFLKTNKIPDPWLAEALDHLTREAGDENEKPQFIDYSELEVRHLGSIYEGLLEFHLKIADVDKAIVREKGHEVYKLISEVTNPKEIVKQGELYLENDKHERKSTGSYYIILALLNSKLLSHFQIRRSQLAQRDDFPKLSLEEARRFPMRRIDFTTAETDRKHLVEKSKSLYERCLLKNDLLCVTGFVDHCLKQDPERADVVHDLLSFLAEQMMSLNNKNQAETTGFLHWLEMTVGAKINSLKNKTKIANYHDDTLATLLDVLKENRKALKVNPSNKEFFDGLKDAFEKSSIILSPLKNRTATTDRLIDLIVYRLTD